MSEFVPRGYLALGKALEHFGRLKYAGDWEIEKDSSKQEFQQLLFEGTLSAKLLTNYGVLNSLPSRDWGSVGAERIFETGRTSISVGNEYFPDTVHGPVLIEQSSIDALFDGDSDDPSQSPEAISDGAEQDESNLPVDTDPVSHVPLEPPNIGDNDQGKTPLEQSAGSGVRSKTPRKVGKRIGDYHTPMCAALDSLCSNHGLDIVEGWGWTHLRQRIEIHPLFQDKHTLPEDTQFRKVCSEWFDKAAKSGKYQNDSR